ncbi:MAG: GIY-YIG nuclease family protein, partial [Alphaproteobacteria bacterium]|jgi:hypothetical protein|nr:GIY-YIG nuclease family protein [Alphaproteobacteria bacterium]
MAKGIVYIVQNPAFSHLFKVGITGKPSVKDRGLDASNVPEDYKTLFAYECNNPEEIEALLHETFIHYRHHTTNGRKTEFFYIGCLKQAQKHLEALENASSNIREITEEFQDSIDEERQSNSEYDKTKSIETFTRRSNFNFEEMGIPAGSILNFIKDPKIQIKVLNSRQVEYKSESHSFSRITAQLSGSKANYVQPTRYWLYNGRNLRDIYDETYPIE